MTRTYEGFQPEHLAVNQEYLQTNPYPGRGIVQGLSEDGESYLQAYWVMGRSENSRNRIFVVNADDSVSTQAYDSRKVTDPSLIIYRAMDDTVSNGESVHVVTNGHQTDGIVRSLGRAFPRTRHSNDFSNALMSWDYEPDAPNYTPRISGYVALSGTYGFSIITRDNLTGNSVRTTTHGTLDELPQGAGLCVHTYEGDGNPLPSFNGNPYPVPVAKTAQTTAEALWEVLDTDNRVAIVAKSIGRETGDTRLTIINQLDEIA